MSAETTTVVGSLGPWRLERAAAAGERSREPGSARWVPVGTRSSGVLGQVDPAGLVGLRDAGWSLDWWIGADDRWYLPARETAVRQELVDGSPVVETRQRLPGGDLVQRVHAAQGSAAFDDREVVVVDLTNETPVPVALALAVRPYGVASDGGITHIDRVGARALLIDGEWSVVADRDARRGASSSHGADPVAVVTSGQAADDWSTVDDDGGRASMALVFPLPHTATMRVVLMAGPVPEDSAAAVNGLPDGVVVASGWERQADHGLRAVLPDGPLAGALTTARRRLLLGSPDVPTLPSAADRAIIARALSALGHGDDLRPIVADVLDGQRLTGAFSDGIGSEAATGATLALLGWWWRDDPRPELLDELVGPLAKAAHRLERRRFIRKHRRDPRRRGLLPSGPQPAELGLPFMAYLDDWWAAAGLLECAGLLEVAGQGPASVDAARFARGVLDDVDRTVTAVTPGLADEAVPAGPDRPLDEGIVGLLVALTFPGVIDVERPSVVRTLELIRAELVDDRGRVQAGVAGATSSPWLTACLALHEITVGDERGVDRLAGLVRLGGPALSWPRRLDERGLGHGGGDDPVAVATVALALRALAFVERRPTGAVHSTGLDILPVVPESWLGSGMELHDAPTSFGTFGYAVRWHGERPALLWELEPCSGRDLPVITASGLAPGWSTSEPVGETLLPAPAPATAGAGPGSDSVQGTSDDDISFN